MLSLLLCAQLAVATPALIRPISRRRCATLVAARGRGESCAAAGLLASYTSRIETELSLLLRDTLGREHTAEVEQLATAAHVGSQRPVRSAHRRVSIAERRRSVFDAEHRARVDGAVAVRRSSVDGRVLQPARAQQPGHAHRRSSVRARSRLVLSRSRAATRSPTLRAGTRRIPIVRIHVHPNFHGADRLGAFDGEIDLDADRAQIVRMRGQFVDDRRHADASRRDIAQATRSGRGGVRRIRERRGRREVLAARVSAHGVSGGFPLFGQIAAGLSNRLDDRRHRGRRHRRSADRSTRRTRRA